jgi:uncharacterized protein YndB with AHSA1/START domain
VKKSAQTWEIKLERMIPAPAGEVFDAWLDPKIPGSPWHENEKLIVNPKVDGLWYWRFRGKAIFGRFVEMDRPHRVQYSWMSRNTLGEESMVTVTFQMKGEETLMTLLHSGLPNDEEARGHETGWSSILGRLAESFGGGSQ